MTLGDILKQYRERNEVSMEEFSKQSSLSKGYISMLENNINPRNNKPIAPTLPTIQKIANGMNIDIDVLLKALDSEQEISLDSDITTDNSSPSIYTCMGQRIKQRRTIMGYTQDELASKLGLQKSAIAKYENGRVENIKRSIIERMANILECDPSYLIGWADNVSSSSTLTLSDIEEKIVLEYRKSDELTQAMVLRVLSIDEVLNSKGKEELA